MVKMCFVASYKDASVWEAYQFLTVTLGSTHVVVLHPRSRSCLLLHCGKLDADQRMGAFKPSERFRV